MDCLPSGLTFIAFAFKASVAKALWDEELSNAKIAIAFGCVLQK